MLIDELTEAHRHSASHRGEILSSHTCGCFHCLATYSPTSITEWCDFDKGVGQTALCPHCGVDSVIGSASSLPITKDFLTRMQIHWF